ncbi:unnamed protein product [Protopolystoma xenopodis]|uniref:Uncharacterized protein n=1 Tax=Protopolystoma xenopodis TaxID=117903 RepID=A0A3S5ADN5_9PLAT|nr:unnamed protein product [Protopolystoma xenopodis]
MKQTYICYNNRLRGNAAEWLMCQAPILHCHGSTLAGGVDKTDAFLIGFLVDFFIFLTEVCLDAAELLMLEVGVIFHEAYPEDLDLDAGLALDFRLLLRETLVDCFFFVIARVVPRERDKLEELRARLALLKVR